MFTQRTSLIMFLLVSSSLILPAFSADQALSTDATGVTRRQLSPEQQAKLSAAIDNALRQSRQTQKELKESLERLNRAKEEINKTAAAGLKTISEYYERSAQENLRELPALEQQLGRSHPIVLAKYTTVAVNYLNKGQLKQADDLFTWLVAAREKTSGCNGYDTGEALLNLAETKRLEGLKTQAAPLYKRSIQILSTTHGPIPSCDFVQIDKAKRGLESVQ